MMNVLFDDWLFRDEKRIKPRLKLYQLLLVFLTIINVAILIMTFFYWYIIIFALLFITTLVYGYFEYLKVKNNHLIIYENRIQIINRFKKEKIFDLTPNQYSINLKDGINRGSGLFLIFKDQDGKVITKYEDMFNYPSPYQEDKTEWEIKIKEVGCRINDPNEIIKN